MAYEIALPESSHKAGKTMDHERILSSRKALIDNLPTDVRQLSRSSDAAEGGCGVLGLASNVPIAGRHVLTASQQMHNRGNGKGGGIAMAGLDPAQMGVPADTLRTHYILQVALIDPSARAEVEEQYITPVFDVTAAYEVEHLEDFSSIPDLDVRPPDVWRYFVRVKQSVLADFAAAHGLEGSPPREVEDEFVYQNSFKLNTAFYASLGEKRAFVMSHARDLIIMKIVGYAEQVVAYYKLEDATAHIWIGHQRYPTKGRVWHPGGAHPFVGLNEALVHNGDFANYHAVSTYLRQRNIAPLFLTDTEVSVQLFDLWDRVYHYPLEVTLEAMAPTTEFDYAMLPDEKKQLYRAVQAAHMHGSPDGPWFFIIARSKPDEGIRELLGITDTSMLRPQVFALYENHNDNEAPVQIGLIASERQAINACLRSLSESDPRFEPVADRYWVARGGSHTDGGSFRFTVRDSGQLECANKFGSVTSMKDGRRQLDRQDLDPSRAMPDMRRSWEEQIFHGLDNGGPRSIWPSLTRTLREATWDEAAWGIQRLLEIARMGRSEWEFGLAVLTDLHDRPFDMGSKKRASMLGLLDAGITSLLDHTASIDGRLNGHPSAQRRISWDSRECLRAPSEGEHTLVIDALCFPPEGEDSAARLIARAYTLGWMHIVAYNWRGGRFAGAGIGPDSYGLRLDLYGDVGDYAGSGLDGCEMHIHGAGQDQLGQILRRGKLVVHGDVGQTFLYGAKGGEVYVRGSAAGRPLINAVGCPRVVINGTCLDYLAESFMAGDPHTGGGFVILNGITIDDVGTVTTLESPYPGGNLLSLASGGAIYVRDPNGILIEDQLNGGTYAPLSDDDWALIEPYLQENERLFGIRVEDLLTVDGTLHPPGDVYRKVVVAVSDLLTEASNR